MLTREEIESIQYHCIEHNKTYKDRLAELGIPEWKFYAAKQKYAQDKQEEGKFLQLNPSNADAVSGFFCTNSKTGSSNKKTSRKDEESTLVNIEMKTATGNLLRIQGEFMSKVIQDIILASSGYVQP